MSKPESIAYQLTVTGLAHALQERTGHGSIPVAAGVLGFLQDYCCEHFTDLVGTAADVHALLGWPADWPAGLADPLDACLDAGVFEVVPTTPAQYRVRRFWQDSERHLAFRQWLYRALEISEDD